MAATFALIMALLPKPPQIPFQPGDKVMHMIAFATLGALAAAGWRERPLLHLFAVLAVFGGAIEVLQTIPALHRDAEWADWSADMGAAIVGISLIRLMLARRPLGSSRLDNGSDT